MPQNNSSLDGYRLQLLIDAVVDYAIYMIDPEGRVLSWNSGGIRLKGYSADEIIGRHFSEFYTPEDRAARLPAKALATARESGRFHGEGWRVRKDGTRFWALVVVDAIKDTSGVWGIDYADNGFGFFDVYLTGYGFADAVPWPADYDGDGRADLSVRSTNGSGAWYFDYSSDGFGGWNIPWDAGNEPFDYLCQDNNLDPARMVGPGP